MSGRTPSPSTPLACALDLGIEVAVLHHPGQFDDALQLYLAPAAADLRRAQRPDQGAGLAAQVGRRPVQGCHLFAQSRVGADPVPLDLVQPLFHPQQRIRGRRQQCGHLQGRAAGCARTGPSNDRSAGRARGRRRATGPRRAVRLMSMPTAWSGSTDSARQNAAGTRVNRSRAQPAGSGVSPAGCPVRYPLPHARSGSAAGLPPRGRPRARHQCRLSGNPRRLSRALDVGGPVGAPPRRSTSSSRHPAARATDRRDLSS